MAAEDAAPAPHPTVVRLQILGAEHWSLLASRGLAWNETFSRAGMYLSTLSGAMVALGLIAGIDGFGPGFTSFALVVLPLVLFVGITTFLRMGATNYHDAIAIVGMNRIRAAYVTLAPDLEPYFVMGTHDDPAGIARTMAVPPGMPALVHVVSAAPFVVNVLNAAIAGSIAAIAAMGVTHLDGVVAVAVAAITFGCVLGAQLRLVAANVRRGRGELRPLFPSGRPEQGTP
jgi:hypothetical protein